MGKGSKLAAVVLGAAMALGLGSRDAKASLVWNVTSSSSVADYDSGREGNERMFSYDVTNLSSDKEYDDAIKSFTLDFGKNKGVYSVDAPEGWNYTLGDNQTTFNTVISEAPIRSDSVRFSLFSENPYIGTELGGLAGAVSEADDHFGELRVDRPAYIPEPATSALLGLGGLLALKRRKKSLNKE